jgi:hypothetical protein
MMNPNKVFGAHEKGFLERPENGFCSRKMVKRSRKAQKIPRKDRMASKRVFKT